MRLTVTFLGLDLLSIEVSTDAADDCSRDLSGGTLATDRIDPGPTTLTLGFTGGWECGDDD